MDITCAQCAILPLYERFNYLYHKYFNKAPSLRRYRNESNYVYPITGIAHMRITDVIRGNYNEQPDQNLYHNDYGHYPYRMFLSRQRGI